MMAEIKNEERCFCPICGVNLLAVNHKRSFLTRTIKCTVCKSIFMIQVEDLQKPYPRIPANIGELEREQNG